MALLLTGGRINAQTAAHFGLINQVIQKEERITTAKSYVSRIATSQPLAAQTATQFALCSRELDPTSVFPLESLTICVLRASEDVKGGAAAFGSLSKSWLQPSEHSANGVAARCLRNLQCRNR